MRRLALCGVLLLSLGACARDHNGWAPPGPPRLPYDTWYVGLAAPRYMEVWVESVDVLDQRGMAFFRVHGGVAAYTNKAADWHQGGGAMKPVSNIDLPEMLFVRWQSLVEPQTYKATLPIPPWVRDEMVRPERVFCQGSQKWKDDYRRMISLGLAPGGIVKVWVGGPCLPSKEVGRYQAKVEPLGPYKGKSKGKYIPLEPENKAYIEQNGVPYSSC
ncbi:DUF2931 family protein [Pseudomonas sp. BN606]|uniref:DUF2931 family protein n=2 Tax=Pseudomonas sp. BN606 TaxID=2567894 RepID=UPI002457DC26|nr:DUF2931 family protein [Pseudomonas sp. BN606]MDH4653351.1 DUF2931 family protein [Pseudomonas sp. BN606]